MRSVFSRAVVVAGAVAVVLGSTAGAAAAKPRPPVLAFTPASYNYGQVAAGGAASQTFTLANTGGQATGKLRVTLTGAAAFTITGDTCHSLGPGKRCTVTVRFAPAGAGTVTAALTAAAKKFAATATVALTGTAGLGAAPGHLYWATDSTISEANLDGSSPRVLVAGQSGAEALAVDASHLYWTNTANGTISEANLDGSDPHVIVSDVLSHGVAVDASHLYWTAAGEGVIYEANLDGTNPQALVSDQDGPWGVAVDASHLFWTNNNNGTISEANLDGSSPHFILVGQDSPSGIAVGAPAGGLLYWANTAGSTNGTINSATLVGTNSGSIVTGQNSPVGVAVSTTSVYWANPFGGTVNQANIDGSNPHALFTDQFDPYGVAVGP